jgi:beta-glucosidase
MRTQLPSPLKGRLGKTVAGVLTAGALIIGSAIAPAAALESSPWMDTDLSPDQRAAVLIAAMTLEEKVELVTGNQGDAPTAYYNAPIERLGIPSLRMADAGAGIANRGWTIPGTGGSATAMPSGIALAATFNPSLSTRYAGVVADEAKQTGHNMLLGPNADIVRTPWWGRIAETESEDTFLTTSITTPYVKAVQAKNVIADLKHYVAYNQETNRGVGQDSVVDERALQEVYIPPYADAIAKAKLGSIMCSFNKINGEFACENDYALDDILREQLGFSGFVITDFGAIHSTEPSITAGTDLETGTSAFYDGVLLAAVQGGQIPVSLVDRSVLRVLSTMFRIGLFDNDYTASSIPVAAHGRVARAVQDQAITLLKNDNKTLPLRRNSIDSIAVIGADATITAAAGGASHVTPTYEKSLLSGIRSAVRPGTVVTYSAGNDPVNGANMIEAADMTAVPSSVLSQATGDGPGLTAEYWDNPTFTGDPGLTRTEPQVNYDTGFIGGQPAFEALYASQVEPTPALSGPLGAGQSVRYTGFLTAPGDGDYELSLTGWGDAELYVDDVLVSSLTGADGVRVSDTSDPLTLAAGQQVAVRVEYSSNHPLNSLEPGTLLLQWSTPESLESPALTNAVEAAAASDVAVVYVRTYESEQRDRLSLKLPQSADQLITAVREANPRTIVVLASAGAVTMPWLNSTPAVVQSYFGGQEEGASIARVLFGAVNPSGHLPITYPTSETDVPSTVTNPWEGADDTVVEYADGIDVGYKAYLKEGVEPLFPFGYGLSYSTFRWNRFSIADLNSARASSTATVKLVVTNTSSVRGTDVVQVYTGELPTPIDTSVKRLAGYAKVTLGAGERKTVTVKLDRSAFRYWDAEADEWVTPRGNVAVYVGRSATNSAFTGEVTVR